MHIPNKAERNCHENSCKKKQNPFRERTPSHFINRKTPLWQKLCNAARLGPADKAFSCHSITLLKKKWVLLTLWADNIGERGYEPPSSDEWNEPWPWVSCRGFWCERDLTKDPVNCPWTFFHILLFTHCPSLVSPMMYLSSKASTIMCHYLVLSSIFAWLYGVSRATLLANNVIHWTWLSLKIHTPHFSLYEWYPNHFF